MSELLGVLIRANLAVSLVALLVVALRLPTRRLFGSRVAYLLWALLPITLLAAMLPTAVRPSMSSPTLEIAARLSGQLAWTSLQAGVAPILPAMLGVWVLGVALSASSLLRSQLRFLRHAKSGSVGPAVVGIVFPKIFLPRDFETAFSADERRMILTHERMHLRRGDIFVRAATTCLQCLFWFNPIVHLVGYLVRLDQELACDADVIERFPGRRRTYAEAMLKSQMAGLRPVLGCSWPTRAPNSLHARIAMLSRKLPTPAWRRSGMILVALLSLVSGAAAWALHASGQAPPAIRGQTATSGSSGLTMQVMADADDGANHSGYVHARFGGEDVWLDPLIAMSNDMVSRATVKARPSGPLIEVEFTPIGKVRFAEVTGENIGRRLAVLVDGKVIFAPVIREAITGGLGEISGDFSLDEAKRIAAEISATNVAK